MKPRFRLWHLMAAVALTAVAFEGGDCYTTMHGPGFGLTWHHFGVEVVYDGVYRKAVVVTAGWRLYGPPR